MRGHCVCSRFVCRLVRRVKSYSDRGGNGWQRNYMLQYKLYKQLDHPTPANPALGPESISSSSACRLHVLSLSNVYCHEYCHVCFHVLGRQFYTLSLQVPRPYLPSATLRMADGSSLLKDSAGDELEDYEEVLVKSEGDERTNEVSYSNETAGSSSK